MIKRPIPTDSQWSGVPGLLFSALFFLLSSPVFCAQAEFPKSSGEQSVLARLSFPLRFAPVTVQQPQPGEQDAVIEDIEIRNNRRIPKESILYYIQSKPGDRVSRDQLRRDLEAVIGTGWFDPLQTRLFEDVGPRGGRIIIFQVKEYPIIRDLQYRGMKSVTESDVLTRFKERRVGVSKESQLDPAKVNAARNVLRELISEKGHPDAQVEVEIQEISATAVGLVFDVNEGPRVRVKEIVFVTNDNKFSQRQLRRAMKYTREAGLFSSFGSKDIYFKEKLEADLQGQLRLFLGNKGYLQAVIGEPKIERAGTVSNGIPIPLLRRSGPGLRITIPIDVGRRYKVARVEEKGVTLFPAGVITAVTGLRVGEYATAKAIQDGVYKNIKDLYGNRGYIQASAEFIPKFIDDPNNPEEGTVEVTLEVEEGKQFTLRRLEFIGNSNTRDVVMRREVVINEGDPYSKQLWDLSILRLNQLGLFEEIKEKDAITRTNDRDQTVDIDLQVKERGRQQIQLNGGVSGIGGSFFGISYSTNNLLGYGESLEFNVSAGNRQKYFLFGVTEPYFLGRPVSVGMQLFLQEYQFIGQGFNFSANQQLLQAAFFGLSSVNADTLFTQRTAGGTISATAPLAFFSNRFPRLSRFTRVGLSYSLTATSLQDPKVNRDNDPTNDIPVTFTQPRILTSRITPSLSYNSLNSSLDPTHGQSIFLGFSLAGGILGGDVSTFAPSLEYKFFRPMLRKRSELPHVLGMRFLASHIRSFGTPFQTDSFSFVGGVPIFERFFLGGEYDIRGYNIRSISPLVPVTQFLSTKNVVPRITDASGNLVDVPPGSNILPKDQNGNVVLNPGTVARTFTFDAPEAGTPCAGLAGPKVVNGALCNVAQAAPYFTPVGGDTQFVYNIEYRVPLFTQKLQAVAFADVGTAFNARKYEDQVVKTPFIKAQVLNARDASGNPVPIQVGPDGRIAAPDEVANNPSSIFRNVFAVGDTRRFEIVRLSQGSTRVFSDIRSSLGAEIRVQMPVINVPFRLIFAYNPNAKTSLDPNVNPGLFIFGLERKTVVRFSVGRTF
jgi:outer membrane protein insertion porin family